MRHMPNTFVEFIFLIYDVSEHRSQRGKPSLSRFCRESVGPGVPHLCETKKNKQTNTHKQNIKHIQERRKHTQTSVYLYFLSLRGSRRGHSGFVSQLCLPVDVEVSRFVEQHSGWIRSGQVDWIRSGISESAGVKGEATSRGDASSPERCFRKLLPTNPLGSEAVLIKPDLFSSCRTGPGRIGSGRVR